MKKLFIRISFLLICQASMSQKSLGPLGPTKLANIWKIKLQKSVFTVINKISIFQSRTPVLLTYFLCFVKKFFIKKLQSSYLQKERCLFWRLLAFWYSYDWNKKECMLQNFLTHIETMLNLWRNHNH